LPDAELSQETCVPLWIGREFTKRERRMNVYREKSRWPWMDVPPREDRPLGGSTTADVAVIGSGIAGLSTAYELAAAGAKVVLVDRGPIARGMSARTSAHLTSALDDFYHAFISIRGEDIARRHFESQAAAIKRIGEIQASEGIDCDFARMPAYLFLAGKEKPETLDAERDALDSVGLKGSRVIQHPSVSHRLSDGPCLVIPDQGRFHPLKYLDGLARSCERRGVRLFSDTCVTRIAEEGSGVSVETETGHRISAGAAVVATNTPINDRLTIHAKQAPYRTFVLTAVVPKGAVDDVLYWDTEDPYHYVRLHPFPDETLILVGGEDHKSGRADDAVERFQSLERWARERFPEMGAVRHRWSGQVMDTIDYAAFIGPNPGNERIFVATGDSGQGITHGVVASLLLPALIAGKEHPWAEAYTPARKPLKTAGKFLGESLDVFKSMAEHILPGEIESEESLAPGSGGILRDGGRTLAVCRDEDGTLHRLSASCSHVGCVVHWNGFEQCWDCPCHGSHFAPDGTALNAPAIEPLKPAAAATKSGRREAREEAVT
jgi:glycine/D-amino acid oxidase-like deaminating enzyme/nitrite reductase/ring-hydroxylating ferredoxin subunit